MPALILLLLLGSNVPGGWCRMLTSSTPYNNQATQYNITTNVCWQFGKDLNTLSKLWSVNATAYPRDQLCAAQGSCIYCVFGQFQGYLIMFEVGILVVFILYNMGNTYFNRRVRWLSEVKLGYLLFSLLCMHVALFVNQVVVCGMKFYATAAGYLLAALIGFSSSIDAPSGDAVEFHYMNMVSAFLIIAFSSVTDPETKLEVKFTSTLICLSATGVVATLLMTVSIPTRRRVALSFRHSWNFLSNHPLRPSFLSAPGTLRMSSIESSTQLLPSFDQIEQLEQYFQRLLTVHASLHSKFMFWFTTIRGLQVCHLAALSVRMGLDFHSYSTGAHCYHALWRYRLILPFAAELILIVSASLRSAWIARYAGRTDRLPSWRLPWSQLMDIARAWYETQCELWRTARLGRASLNAWKTLAIQCGAVLVVGVMSIFGAVAWIVIYAVDVAAYLLVGPPIEILTRWVSSQRPRGEQFLLSMDSTSSELPLSSSHHEQLLMSSLAAVATGRLEQNTQSTVGIGRLRFSITGAASQQTNTTQARRQPTDNAPAPRSTGNVQMQTNPTSNTQVQGHCHTQNAQTLSQHAGSSQPPQVATQNMFLSVEQSNRMFGRFFEADGSLCWPIVHDFLWQGHCSMDDLTIHATHLGEELASSSLARHHLNLIFRQLTLEHGGNLALRAHHLWRGCGLEKHWVRWVFQEQDLTYFVANRLQNRPARPRNRPGLSQQGRPGLSQQGSIGVREDVGVLKVVLALALVQDLAEARQEVAREVAEGVREHMMDVVGSEFDLALLYAGAAAAEAPERVWHEDI